MITRQSRPADASRSGRCRLHAAALAAVFAGSPAAWAEPDLPSLFFPGITDPFSVIPPGEVPPGSPPPLLTPNTPPRPLVPPLVPPLVAVPIPRSDAANCVRRDSAGRFLGWMDYQHCVYSGRSLATARWFDDFFGDWHDDEASMMVRVISQTAIEEYDGVSTKLTVRASADLPNARRRVRLIVSDESDPDETVAAPPGSEPRRDESQSSAALRFLPEAIDDVETALDLGVRGVDPPDLFVRMRGRKSWGLTRDSIVRVAQTFRYGSESEERSVTQVDVERALDNNSVLRFGNSWDYFAPRNSEGFYWTHSLSLSHALKRSRSLSYGVSMSGPTQPDWVVENFGPWVAYRRSFLRHYLFYELGPRYTWYRESDWQGRVSMVVRLEWQFGVRK